MNSIGCLILMKIRHEQFQSHLQVFVRKKEKIKNSFLVTLLIFWWWTFALRHSINTKIRVSTNLLNFNSMISIFFTKNDWKRRLKSFKRVLLVRNDVNFVRGYSQDRNECWRLRKEVKEDEKLGIQSSKKNETSNKVCFKISWEVSLGNSKFSSSNLKTVDLSSPMSPPSPLFIYLAY